MKFRTARLYVPVLGLLVAAITVTGFGSSTSNEAYAGGEGLQAGLSTVGQEAVAAAPSTSWLSTLAGIDSSGELVSRGAGDVTAETGASLVGSTSPILGTDPKLGAIAAPVTRFRDGGHAYYLYGKGLHSCTYVGKCMDLFAAIGEPVYAMADGVVKVPKYAANSYGNYVIITFRDGTKAIYAHLDEVSIAPGPVAAGQLIGTVGCSGTSGESNKCKRSEQHLHLEWNGLKWKPGQYGQLPPYFDQWRGDPMRCYRGCGPNKA